MLQAVDYGQKWYINSIDLSVQRNCLVSNYGFIYGGDIGAAVLFEGEVKPVGGDYVSNRVYAFGRDVFLPIH